MQERDTAAGGGTRAAAGAGRRRCAAGMLAGALLVLAACATPGARPAPVTPREPWRQVRAAVIAAINRARTAEGLRPLAYDPVLELVGDAFCARLAAEDLSGHVAADGVPPYLRYLVAGGHGYHLENVGAVHAAAPVRPWEVEGMALESLRRMLAERPPNDGHRRVLLDPALTHVGIGVAVRGRELRVSHELATEVASEWEAPPAAARPGASLRLAGRVPAPWHVTAVEVLRGPLPRPPGRAALLAAHGYSYPPASASSGRRAPGPAASSPGAPTRSGSPRTAPSPSTGWPATSPPSRSRWSGRAAPPAERRCRWPPAPPP